VDHQIRCRCGIDSLGAGNGHANAHKSMPLANV
jgi:hypothetical protein